MTRRFRNREHPAQEPVSSYTVAPDHYNDPQQSTMNEYLATTWKEFRDAVPYKAGDVVWIEYWETNGKVARKAYICDVYPEITYDGWKRAKFRVFVANKTGDRFSKNFIYTWPGFIERGYTRAKDAN